MKIFKSRFIELKQVNVSVYLLVLLSFFIAFPAFSGNPNNYPFVDLCSMNLNRTATQLTAQQLATVPPAAKGFVWDNDDNTTLYWRPQSMTNIDLDCRKYMVIAWYGMSSQGYANRGAKISFVDISDMNHIKYRHVLLVDENYNTFFNIHASGLFYENDMLYLTDTRSPDNKKLIGFNINEIQKVLQTDLGNFYGFEYVLRKNNAQELPIKGSTLAYDWDAQQLAISEFNMDCGDCIFNPATKISWHDLNAGNSDSPYYSNFFNKAQGFVSLDNLYNGDNKMIWFASSYGANRLSHLYATTLGFSTDYIENGQIKTENLEYNDFVLPPGLENIFFEKDKKTLWGLTEFAFGEGTNPTIVNNRFVFAFNRTDILPPGFNAENFEKTSLCDVELNRTATAMDSLELGNIPFGILGFKWNKGDDETMLWQPKGITKITTACKEFIAVSWYGNPINDYQNRGVRISFVDVENPENIKYRHVLLVDEDYLTLKNFQPKSLIFKNDTLFLPDTRDDKKLLYGFALNDLRLVPLNGMENFYDYGYILKRSSITQLPIQSAVLSFDHNEQELIGVRQGQENCDSCIFSKATSFSWMDKNFNQITSSINNNFYADIQGVVSRINHRFPREKWIYTSVNKGQHKKSKLYASLYRSNLLQQHNNRFIDTLKIKYNVVDFPPGLSDFYLERNDTVLWSLLEYNADEITPNHRYVFAINLSGFMPPIDTIHPSTDILMNKNWYTKDFEVFFDDIDYDSIVSKYYLVADFNGSTWNGNTENGFLLDEFDSTRLKKQWQEISGNWSITNHQLLQSDEEVEANLYVACNQNIATQFLYTWRAKMKKGENLSVSGLKFFYHDFPAENSNYYAVLFSSGDTNSITQDHGNVSIYKSLNQVQSVKASAEIDLQDGIWYDFAVSYNKLTGEMIVFLDNQPILSWIDSAPFILGKGILIYSKNCSYQMNNISVLHSRKSTEIVSVGEEKNNDIRFQNTSTENPSGTIVSVVVNKSNNISSFEHEKVNIDWTPPTDLYIFDGLVEDIDTIYKNIIEGNWGANDIHSGIKKYWVAVGTSPGENDVMNWQSIYTTDLSFLLKKPIHQQQYFIAIKAVNGAGLERSINSNGQVYIDTLSPSEVGKIVEVNIFPNPTKDYLLFENIKDEYEVLIYGYNGEKLKQEIISPFKNKIDIRDLSGGFYMVSVGNKNNFQIKKIIKL